MNQTKMNLKPLAVEQFADFYEAVHGWPPLAWQSELAQQVCLHGWPRWIDLPTSSGKTAVVDMAVFALAFQATQAEPIAACAKAPRRIFFTVDRRLIVSQAYRHGRKLCEALWNAAKNPSSVELPVLVQMAEALLQLSGGGDQAVPLDCYELRGGIPRDDAWVRSPTQPTLLTTTVDQIGSRMLFRGYGVSDRNLPIHAALTANDSLILLDEAHCSVPFGETVEAIEHYRSEAFAQQPIESPLRLVRMTATPPETNAPGEAGTVFRMQERHYEANEILRKRHDCSKPVELVLDDKAKGKTIAKKLAKTLVQQAVDLATKHQCRKVAVVCNRIDIAKETYRLLIEKKHAADLMIGRMRPIDRDAATERLTDLYQSNPKLELVDEDTSATFLVATQTIEVGADFDFDGLVSQCAALDSLKQRFGRLNRLGQHPVCRGVIVAAAGDLVAPDKIDDAKPVDPIYGNALVRTWYALQQHATRSENQSDDSEPVAMVDFAVRGEDSISRWATGDVSGCQTQPPHALTLMPAHVDMLCQTMPKPAPDPDIAMYLHGVPPEGKQTSTPSVRLVWRNDLQMPDWRVLSSTGELQKAFANQARREAWIATVDVCPPATGECMSVPLYLLQMWLKGQVVADDYADVDGESRDEEQVDATEFGEQLSRFGLAFRGGMKTTPGGESFTNSFVVGPRNIRKLRDGDTIVLPAQFGGWDHFGHVPDGPTDPAATEPGRQGIKTFLQAAHEAANASEIPPELHDWKQIDIADEAYEIARAKTVLRIHVNNVDKLIEERSLAERWLKRFAKTDVGLSTQTLIDDVRAWGNEESSDEADDDVSDRLKTLIESGNAGFVKRYPDGFIWVSKRQPLPSGMPPLPSESFDDGLDSRNASGKIWLLDHLADVDSQLRQTLDRIELGESLVASASDAARLHDLGKADPRFQANLMDVPLSRVFMQPHLLAKSGGYGRSRHATLPVGFRHEFLSAALLPWCKLSLSSDESLVRYLVQTHHGFARPLVSSAMESVTPMEIDLSPLGGPIVPPDQQGDLQPGHLNSGIADDFWQMNRRFGYWGIAYLETLLRLADWQASGSPSASPAELSIRWCDSATSTSVKEPQSKTFDAIQADDPLGALAALGLFRLFSKVDPQSRFSWVQRSGTYKPVVFSQLPWLSNDDLIEMVLELLQGNEEQHPFSELWSKKEVLSSEFRKTAYRSSRVSRESTDWMTACFSEHHSFKVGSQLRIARYDYFPGTVESLCSITDADHLRRTLLKPWDFADPLDKVSFRLNPREDRRHAYRWSKPDTDPNSGQQGGMIGANRLALEALPLFQSLPAGDKLQTTGFHGLRVSNTIFSWPVWTTPISIDAVRSLLSLDAIRHPTFDTSICRTLGIAEVFRTSRILVGKTPNFTPATAAAG